jgi:hypothetical protein
VATISGEFFQNCRPGKQTADARNDDFAKRLWAESERIAAAAGALPSH